MENTQVPTKEVESLYPGRSGHEGSKNGNDYLTTL